MEDLPTDIATFVDTHLVDRHNSNAVKWDGLKEEFGRPLYLFNEYLEPSSSVTSKS